MAVPEPISGSGSTPGLTPAPILPTAPPPPPEKTVAEKCGELSTQLEQFLTQSGAILDYDGTIRTKLAEIKGKLSGSSPDYDAAYRELILLAQTWKSRQADFSSLAVNEVRLYERPTYVVSQGNAVTGTIKPVSAGNRLALWNALVKTEGILLTGKETPEQALAQLQIALTITDPLEARAQHLAFPSKYPGPAQRQLASGILPTTTETFDQARLGDNLAVGDTNQDPAVTAISQQLYFIELLLAVFQQTGEQKYLNAAKALRDITNLSSLPEGPVKGFLQESFGKLSATLDSPITLADTVKPLGTDSYLQLKLDLVLCKLALGLSGLQQNKEVLTVIRDQLLNTLPEISVPEESTVEPQFLNALQLLKQNRTVVELQIAFIINPTQPLSDDAITSLATIADNQSAGWLSAQAEILWCENQLQVLDSTATKQDKLTVLSELAYRLNELLGNCRDPQTKALKYKREFISAYHLTQEVIARLYEVNNLVDGNGDLRVNRHQVGDSGLSKTLEGITLNTGNDDLTKALQLIDPKMQYSSDGRGIAGEISPQEMLAWGIKYYARQSRQTGITAIKINYETVEKIDIPITGVMSYQAYYDFAQVAEAQGDLPRALVYYREAAFWANLQGPVAKGARDKKQVRAIYQNSAERVAALWEKLQFAQIGQVGESDAIWSIPASLKTALTSDPRTSKYFGTDGRLLQEPPQLLPQSTEYDQAMALLYPEDPQAQGIIPTLQIPGAETPDLIVTSEPWKEALAILNQYPNQQPQLNVITILLRNCFPIDERQLQSLKSQQWGYLSEDNLETLKALLSDTGNTIPADVRVRWAMEILYRPAISFSPEYYWNSEERAFVSRIDLNKGSQIQLREAIQLLEQVIKDNPLDYRAYWKLGLIHYYYTGNVQAAEQYLKLAYTRANVVLRVVGGAVEFKPLQQIIAEAPKLIDAIYTDKIRQTLDSKLLSQNLNGTALPGYDENWLDSRTYVVTEDKVNIGDHVGTEFNYRRGIGVNLDSAGNHSIDLTGQFGTGSSGAALGYTGRLNDRLTINANFGQYWDTLGMLQGGDPESYFTRFGVGATYTFEDKGLLAGAEAPAGIYCDLQDLTDGNNPLGGGLSLSKGYDIGRSSSGQHLIAGWNLGANFGNGIEDLWVLGATGFAVDGSVDILPGIQLDGGAHLSLGDNSVYGELELGNGKLGGFFGGIGTQVTFMSLLDPKLIPTVLPYLLGGMHNLSGGETQFSLGLGIVGYSNTSRMPGDRNIFVSWRFDKMFSAAITSLGITTYQIKNPGENLDGRYGYARDTAGNIIYYFDPDPANGQVTRYSIDADSHQRLLGKGGIDQDWLLTWNYWLQTGDRSRRREARQTDAQSYNRRSGEIQGMRTLTLNPDDLLNPYKIIDWCGGKPVAIDLHNWTIDGRAMTQDEKEIIIKQRGQVDASYLASANEQVTTLLDEDKYTEAVELLVNMIRISGKDPVYGSRMLEVLTAWGTNINLFDASGDVTVASVNDTSASDKIFTTYRFLDVNYGGTYLGVAHDTIAGLAAGRLQAIAVALGTWSPELQQIFSPTAKIDMLMEGTRVTSSGQQVQPQAAMAMAINSVTRQATAVSQYIDPEQVEPLADFILASLTAEKALSEYSEWEITQKIINLLGEVLTYGDTAYWRDPRELGNAILKQLEVPESAKTKIKVDCADSGNVLASLIVNLLEKRELARSNQTERTELPKADRIILFERVWNVVSLTDAKSFGVSDDIYHLSTMAQLDGTWYRLEVPSSDTTKSSVFEPAQQINGLPVWPDQAAFRFCGKADNLHTVTTLTIDPSKALRVSSDKQDFGVYDLGGKRRVGMLYTLADMAQQLYLMRNGYSSDIIEMGYLDNSGRRSSAQIFMNSDNSFTVIEHSNQEMDNEVQTRFYAMRGVSEYVPESDAELTGYFITDDHETVWVDNYGRGYTFNYNQSSQTWETAVSELLFEGVSYGIPIDMIYSIYTLNGTLTAGSEQNLSYTYEFNPLTNTVDITGYSISTTTTDPGGSSNYSVDGLNLGDIASPISEGYVAKVVDIDETSSGTGTNTTSATDTDILRHVRVTYADNSNTVWSEVVDGRIIDVVLSEDSQTVERYSEDNRTYLVVINGDGTRQLTIALSDAHSGASNIGGTITINTTSYDQGQKINVDYSHNYYTTEIVDPEDAGYGTRDYTDGMASVETTITITVLTEAGVQEAIYSLDIDSPLSGISMHIDRNEDIAYQVNPIDGPIESAETNSDGWLDVNVTNPVTGEVVTYSVGSTETDSSTMVVSGGTMASGSEHTITTVGGQVIVYQTHGEETTTIVTDWSDANGHLEISTLTGKTEDIGKLEVSAWTSSESSDYSEQAETNTVAMHTDGNGMTHFDLTLGDSSFNDNHLTINGDDSCSYTSDYEGTTIISTVRDGETISISEDVSGSGVTAIVGSGAQNMVLDLRDIGGVGSTIAGTITEDVTYDYNTNSTIEISTSGGGHTSTEEYDLTGMEAALDGILSDEEIAAIFDSEDSSFIDGMTDYLESQGIDTTGMSDADIVESFFSLLVEDFDTSAFTTHLTLDEKTVTVTDTNKSGTTAYSTDMTILERHVSITYNDNGTATWTETIGNTNIATILSDDDQTIEYEIVNDTAYLKVMTSEGQRLMTIVLTNIYSGTSVLNGTITIDTISYHTGQEIIIDTHETENLVQNADLSSPDYGETISAERTSTEITITVKTETGTQEAQYNLTVDNALTGLSMSIARNENITYSFNPGASDEGVAKNEDGWALVTVVDPITGEEFTYAVGETVNDETTVTLASGEIEPNTTQVITTNGQSVTVYTISGTETTAMTTTWNGVDGNLVVTVMDEKSYTTDKVEVQNWYSTLTESEEYNESSTSVRSSTNGEGATVYVVNQSGSRYNQNVLYISGHGTYTLTSNYDELTTKLSTDTGNTLVIDEQTDSVTATVVTGTNAQYLYLTIDKTNALGGTVEGDLTEHDSNSYGTTTTVVVDTTGHAEYNFTGLNANADTTVTRTDMAEIVNAADVSQAIIDYYAAKGEDVSGLSPEELWQKFMQDALGDSATAEDFSASVQDDENTITVTSTTKSGNKTSVQQLTITDPVSGTVVVVRKDRSIAYDNQADAVSSLENTLDIQADNSGIVAIEESTLHSESSGTTTYSGTSQETADVTLDNHQPVGTVTGTVHDEQAWNVSGTTDDGSEIDESHTSTSDLNGTTEENNHSESSDSSTAESGVIAGGSGESAITVAGTNPFQLGMTQTTYETWDYVDGWRTEDTVYVHTMETDGVTTKELVLSFGSSTTVLQKEGTTNTSNSNYDPDTGRYIPYVLPDGKTYKVNYQQTINFSETSSAEVFYLELTTADGQLSGQFAVSVVYRSGSGTFTNFMEIYDPAKGTTVTVHESGEIEVNTATTSSTSTIESTAADGSQYLQILSASRTLMTSHQLVNGISHYTDINSLADYYTNYTKDVYTVGDNTVTSTTEGEGSLAEDGTQTVIDGNYYYFNSGNYDSAWEGVSRTTGLNENGQRFYTIGLEHGQSSSTVGIEGDINNEDFNQAFADGELGVVRNEMSSDMSGAKLRYTSPSGALYLTFWEQTDAYSSKTTGAGTHDSQSKTAKSYRVSTDVSTMSKGKQERLIRTVRDSASTHDVRLLSEYIDLYLPIAGSTSTRPASVTSALPLVRKNLDATNYQELINAYTSLIQKATSDSNLEECQTYIDTITTFSEDLPVAAVMEIAEYLKTIEQSLLNKTDAQKIYSLIDNAYVNLYSSTLTGDLQNPEYKAALSLVITLRQQLMQVRGNPNIPEENRPPIQDTLGRLINVARQLPAPAALKLALLIKDYAPWIQDPLIHDVQLFLQSAYHIIYADAMQRWESEGALVRDTLTVGTTNREMHFWLDMYTDFASAEAGALTATFIENRQQFTAQAESNATNSAALLVKPDSVTPVSYRPAMFGALHLGDLPPIGTAHPAQRRDKSTDGEDTTAAGSELPETELTSAERATIEDPETALEKIYGEDTTLAIQGTLKADDNSWYFGTNMIEGGGYSESSFYGGLQSWWGQVDIKIPVYDEFTVLEWGKVLGNSTLDQVFTGTTADGSEFRYNSFTESMTLSEAYTVIPYTGVNNYTVDSWVHYDFLIGDTVLTPKLGFSFRNLDPYLLRQVIEGSAGLELGTGLGNFDLRYTYRLLDGYVGDHELALGYNKQITDKLSFDLFGRVYFSDGALQAGEEFGGNLYSSEMGINPGVIRLNYANPGQPGYLDEQASFSFAPELTYKVQDDTTTRYTTWALQSGSKTPLSRFSGYALIPFAPSLVPIVGELVQGNADRTTAVRIERGGQAELVEKFDYPYRDEQWQKKLQHQVAEAWQYFLREDYPNMLSRMESSLYLALAGNPDDVSSLIEQYQAVLPYLSDQYSGEFTDRILSLPSNLESGITPLSFEIGAGTTKPWEDKVIAHLGSIFRATNNMQWNEVINYMYQVLYTIDVGTDRDVKVNAMRAKLVDYWNSNIINNTHIKPEQKPSQEQQTSFKLMVEDYEHPIANVTISEYDLLLKQLDGGGNARDNLHMIHQYTRHHDNTKELRAYAKSCRQQIVADNEIYHSDKKKIGKMELSGQLTAWAGWLANPENARNSNYSTALKLYHRLSARSHKSDNRSTGEWHQLWTSYLKGNYDEMITAYDQLSSQATDNPELRDQLITFYQQLDQERFTTYQRETLHTAYLSLTTPDL